MSGPEPFTWNGRGYDCDPLMTQKMLRLREQDAALNRALRAWVAERDAALGARGTIDVVRAYVTAHNPDYATLVADAYESAAQVLRAAMQEQER